MALRKMLRRCILLNTHIPNREEVHKNEIAFRQTVKLFFRRKVF